MFFSFFTFEKKEISIFIYIYIAFLICAFAIIYQIIIN